MKNYILIVFFIVLMACHRHALQPVTHLTTFHNFYTFQADSARDSSIMRIIAPYKIRMQNQMERIICNNDSILVKGANENTLAYLIADAMKAALLELPEAIAIVNRGSVRVPSIETGAITLGEIYELMPFDNMLVSITVDATTIQNLCNYIAKNGGWGVSGITFSVKDSIAYNIQIGSSNLSYDKMDYTVLISDYLANGGENLDFLKHIKQHSLGIKVRDAIVKYCETKKRIAPISGNRIKQKI